MPEIVPENPIQTPEESYDEDWLCKTVAHALNETGYQPNKDLRVLSIGTGPCGLDELYALIMYLSDDDITISEYTAIDIEEKNLEKTREQISEFPMANIICDDARNLPYLVEKEYDVVLIRHPDCDCGEELNAVWKDIFSKVKVHLGEDSRLITTAFWDTGYYVIMSLLDQCGYDIKSFGENDHPGMVMDEKKGVQFDKYLMVAAK